MLSIIGQQFGNWFIEESGLSETEVQEYLTGLYEKSFGGEFVVLKDEDADRVVREKLDPYGSMEGGDSVVRV